MKKLKERLEAISAGELIEAGSEQLLPAFEQKEMDQCVIAITQLVKLAQTSTPHADRLRPPGNTIHVIL